MKERAVEDLFFCFLSRDLHFWHALDRTYPDSHILHHHYRSISCTFSFTLGTRGILYFIGGDGDKNIGILDLCQLYSLCTWKKRDTNGKEGDDCWQSQEDWFLFLYSLCLFINPCLGRSVVLSFLVGGRMLRLAWMRVPCSNLF